jgi:hypothetical protein
MHVGSASTLTKSARCFLAGPIADDRGGLIYYGRDVADEFRRVAEYVDRILRGEKHADLPVQQVQPDDQSQERQNARPRSTH